MSDETTTRPKIRTYAGDLEAAKGRSADKHNHKKATVKSETEDHQMAAPTARKEPVKLAEQKPPASKLPIPPREARPVLKAPIPKSDVPHTEDSPSQKAVPQTKVPAYHELQKAVHNTSSKLSSELNQSSDKEGMVRANIGYDATVITDTKSNRFQLFPELIVSIKRWFKMLSEKRRRKAPTYTVPEASRRKGVIQKAATKTGTIFTADNETLREQIRRRQLEQRRQEKHIKEEEDVSWSPFTETGFKLLEAPEGKVPSPISNVVLEFKKQSLPQVTEPAPSPITLEDTEALESKEAPEPTLEPTPPPPIAPKPATTQPPEPEVVEAKGEPKPKEAPEPTLEPTPPPPIAPKPATVYTPPTGTSMPIGTSPVLYDMVDLGDLNDPLDEEEQEPITLKSLVYLNTNFQVVAIVGLILAVGLLVSSVLIIRNHFFNPAASSEQPLVQLPTPLFSGTTLQSISMDTEQAIASVELRAQIGKTESNQSVEQVFVYRSGEEVNPVELFDMLGFQTLPSLKQSIDSVRVIAINGQAPSFIFTFSDKNTVLGAMLEWEQQLPIDLAAWYQLDATSTEFTDERIDSYDLRVLTNTESVVLLYGFIDENTLLITSSTEAFTQMAALRPRNE